VDTRTQPSFTYTTTPATTAAAPAETTAPAAEPAAAPTGAASPITGLVIGEGLTKANIWAGIGVIAFIIVLGLLAYMYIYKPRKNKSE
jgi:predicted lipid-binding transport protein (Tim44 family)